MVLFSNELVQSYGGIIILILVVVIAFLGYRSYRDQNQTKCGKKLRDNVIQVLKKNDCKISGDKVTCQGPQFAGLGQKFTITEAVDRVLDMISTEMVGGPPMPPSGPQAPPAIPPNPYPGAQGPPSQMAAPRQPQPTGGRPAPRGPPPPMETNPKRASQGGAGPASFPGPAPSSGGGFGGLMSADGEAIGGSLAGSDGPGGYQSSGGLSYNPDMV